MTYRAKGLRKTDFSEMVEEVNETVSLLRDTSI